MSGGGSVVAAVRTELKRPPNPNEQVFIDLNRKIIHQIDHSSQDTKLTGPLAACAKELQNAFDRGGLEAYQTVWQALERHNPKLKHYRKPIQEVPPAPDALDTPDAPEKEDRRFTTTPEGGKLLKLDTIEDIYAAPDPEYLITKILEVATVSLLYGMSGTGKTFTALDLALCVAHGLYWHGRKVKCGPVWYVNTEGKRGLKKRLQAWYKEHDDMTPSPHFRAITWQLDIQEYFQEIIDTLHSLPEKPALIVFDNLSLCAAGVNQNNQEEIAPILKRLHMIADECSSHVMLIHHTNKEGDFNGTMALRNHVDTMIELRKEDKADKDSPILFTSRKARDDEPFGDIRTELKQVILRTDEETSEYVTSCVMVGSEMGQKPHIKALREVEQDCLAIIGEQYLSFSEWQSECIEKMKISTSTFSRVKKVLEMKGYVVKGKIEGKRVDVYHATHAESEAAGE